MKKILSTGFCMLGSLIFFTGCSREENPPPPPPENPVVGVVKTVTHEFTLHAGPEGTLYTIRDSDGEEIAREISPQNLAAEFPELSEELRSLWAGNDRAKVAPMMESMKPLAPAIPVPDHMVSPAR